MVRVNGRALEDYKRFEVRETGLAVPQAEPLYVPAVSNGYAPDDFIIDSSLLLYLPLYLLKGSKFKSVDRSKHSCIVTGALWGPDGRALDGDDYITLPLVITSAMWQGTSDFTLGFVAKTTRFTTTNQIILALGQTVEGWSYGTIGLRYFQIGGVWRNRLSLGVREFTHKADNRWATDDDTNLSDDTLYRVVVVNSSGTVAMYINGVSLGVVNELTGDISGTLGNTKTLIGCRSFDTTETWDSFLNGTVRVLWLYDRALSATEVSHNDNVILWRCQ